MRPGPGLVVMALAFISGARRGSTSTSSKTSSSSRLSSSSSEHEPTAASIIFPSYLGGGGVLTPTSSSNTHQRERKRESTAHQLNEYNSVYDNNYPPPSFALPEHLHKQHDDPRARLESLVLVEPSSRPSRRARAAHNNIVGPADGRASDIIGRAGGGSATQTGAVPLDDDTSDSSTADSSSGNGASSEGLPVKYPSHSLDSSRSFDEDDILALVAEDDLLSEESLDRLTSLTDDKIGYINEEDYSGTEGGGGSADSESAFADSENQQLSESHSVDYNSAGDRGSAYAANLVSSNKNDAALAEGAQTSENVESLLHIAESGGKHTDLRRSIFKSASPLTRLNPWVSACDLAQPGTAPDLQGQCSAGTLPVAWVDEGPGPPTCPKSCEQLRLDNMQNINNFNVKSNNNDKNNDKYFSNANAINFKLSNNYNYNNNNNNNKNYNQMTKTRRDVSEHESGDSLEQPQPSTSAASPTATTTTTTASEQQDSVAVAAINRQSQQNNDIVKQASAGSVHSDSYNNLNFHNYELKYNYLRQQPHDNSHSQNKQNKNKNNNNNLPSNKQNKLKHTDDQEEQQCLDYLGDTDKTSPLHLCGLKSPVELMARLRSLRLRHCCERNVFSALHTIALNATLNGGVECVRVLMDLMDLDALASRITCELAEILFRFDCRQVYSLIHQCDDCKEAYRRWVCSTLVPYFAEPSDIIVPPSNISNNNKTTMTNSSSSSSNHTNNSNNNNRNSTPTSNSTATATNNNNSTSSAAVNKRNSNSYLIQLSSSDNSGNSQLTDDAIFADERKKREIGRSAATTATARTSAAPTFYDVIDYRNSYNNNNSDTTNNNSNYNQAAASSKQKRDADGRCVRKQQSSNNNYFISTANSEDPACHEDPVISKLLKRSKRKVEFRKRRRIRPCLSVCHTVEQKCPYLLPADRAPALPTQYAGEPTFLCLDQNIPETGEQLRKSSYGPPDCCYSYCGEATSGLCTYCSAFAWGSTIEEQAAAATSNKTAHRVHNITLNATHTGATQQRRLDTRLGVLLANDTKARAATVAVALQHDSTALSRHVLERLPYYAYFEGVYYYDDDTNDMPAEALSGDCPAVASVTSRCTIPYYASSATALLQSRRPRSRIALWPPRQLLLLWLGALLCLLSSSQQRRRLLCRGATAAAKRTPHRSTSDELLSTNATTTPATTAPRKQATSGGSSNSRSITSCSPRSSSNLKSSSKRSLKSSSKSKLNSRTVQQIITNNYKFQKDKIIYSAKNKHVTNYSRSGTCKFSEYEVRIHFSSRTSKMKFYCSSREVGGQAGKCTINAKIKANGKADGYSYSDVIDNGGSNGSYRFSYHYNFNINDWWHRWWIRLRAPTSLSTPTS